jgi:hypothetical protein
VAHTGRNGTCDGPPPDWRFWGHVPTATLPEAIALSLGIDPERLRRPRARQMIEGQRRRIARDLNRLDDPQLTLTS